ncbi:Hsp70 family protein [Pendulispora albinea]|uniref:Hsp70 family protein n=1 Tax=Pendulispora albinea TaxID=2741071 RepID=A0ABZ2M6E8_9BACT
MRRCLGLDLGTTNSSLALADADRAVSLARFPHSGGLSETFRSILYFHPDAQDARRGITSIAGGEAIDRYLEADGTGRLIQSLKSYLADTGFESTNVFGRTYSLTELLSFLVRALRKIAEEQMGELGPRIVVGRPVHFSGGRADDDDAFAEGRLRTAIAAAGFEEIVFEYEPVAAAYYYESRLDHDELVLIADFGGGTSDFSLIRVGPSARKAKQADRILGNDGVGIAGDALDAKILHNLVSPSIGLGSSYQSMLGKELPVPVWIYAKLRRWHHLSFLKSKRTTELLREILDQSLEPEKIQALVHIIDHDLGYHLYRAVERSKVALSKSDRTTFLFEDDTLRIEHPLSRTDFEAWIAEETDAMSECVDRLLTRVGVDAREVDRVFMTGGTSFVPAVRNIFDTRFGSAKIEAGGEMISVASGLALRALDLDRA